MQKVTLVLFTYNRAIILDSVLSSIFKNFKNVPDRIHIIYHYNKKHELSYEILKEKWKKFNIQFHIRKNISILNFFLLIFLRPLNIIWLLRWPAIIKNSNDFKFILERIIEKSRNNFITMVTDDQIFFEKTKIPNFIFERLTCEKKTFYRFFTGNHFKDEHKIYENLKIENFENVKPKVFKWNLTDRFAFASWKYRFTIDGTIYKKNDLLELIKPIIYHNPITLEAIGLWESKLRGFFKYGYSAQKRTAAHYQINNVQKLVINQCSNFDPQVLMKAYELGYRLKINKKEFIKNKFNILPVKLNLYKKNKVINYEKFLDFYLKKIYEQ
jgi:hypothetical protein